MTMGISKVELRGVANRCEGEGKRSQDDSVAEVTS